MDSFKTGKRKSHPYLNVGVCFNSSVGVRTLSFIHPFTHKPFVLLTDIQPHHVWGQDEQDLYLENINALLELYAHEQAEPHISMYECNRVGQAMPVNTPIEKDIARRAFRNELNWLTNITIQRDNRCMQLLSIVNI
jgi:hypothetical protein